MSKSFLSVAWVMALVTSVVLLAIAAGAVVIALASPVGSLPQLEAWRGALVAIVLVGASSTLLAALTVVRVRRGEPLAPTDLADEPTPGPTLVVDVDVDVDVEHASS